MINYEVVSKGMINSCFHQVVKRLSESSVLDLQLFILFVNIVFTLTIAEPQKPPAIERLLKLQEIAHYYILSWEHLLWKNGSLYAPFSLNIFTFFRD